MKLNAQIPNSSGRMKEFVSLFLCLVFFWCECEERLGVCLFVSYDNSEEREGEKGGIYGERREREK